MEEPHLVFRKAVEEATKKVGGNMEGFILIYGIKRKNLPDPPEEAEGEKLVIGASASGPSEVNRELHLQVAANLVEAYAQQCRGNVYFAVELMKADILKTLINRERARKP